MDFMTVAGALVGSSAILFVLYHGQMIHFLFNIEAIILIFGGTMGSVMISYPYSALRYLPSVVMKVVFPPKRLPSRELLKILTELASKARRQGIYSLVEEAPRMPHPFLRDCIGMLAYEMDYETMREMLEQDLVSTRARHVQVSNIFRSAGTFAPIFGLLGTLVGVVQVLRNITDPKSMGASMAIAMTASFYGIFTANFIFLPIAEKLNYYSEEEMTNKELIAKGILYIHQGNTPWEVSRKLSTFLSHIHRNGGAQAAGAAAKA